MWAGRGLSQNWPFLVPGVGSADAAIVVVHVLLAGGGHVQWS